MEYLDIELRRENALFISRTVFNNRIRIDDLQKCIDIIKNNNFAESGLKYDLLNLCTPIFWNDLYYLNFYDTTITELKNKLNTVKRSYECTDDIDERYYYNLQIDRFGSEIDSLNTVIELTKQLRKMILKTFHDIETLWKQKLIEHNTLQEKDEAEKLEREVKRAEIRKKNLNAIKKPDAPPPKHNFPTIDSSKFDAKWIFDTYNNVVFKCSEVCFNSWLKDGIQPLETIEFILKGRQDKPAIAQLRKFIESITGDTEKTKDTYYKTVFGLEIKTAHLKTATNLNSTFKELKKKIDELKLKK